MSQYKIKIHGQYIKDLSFENPNLPFLFRKEAPNINIMVNINSVKLEETKSKEGENKGKKSPFYEMILHIEARGTIKDSIAFICEIKYCGVFSVENFTELSMDGIRKALFVGGPTFLFPFAREIIARVTSSGGFPPLMLDPIDFEDMYNKQQEESNIVSRENSAY